MWIETQDRKHLVDINRIHKHDEKHVEYSRGEFNLLTGLHETEQKITYTYQILDENGLIIGEYSTEKQRDKVWKELISHFNYIEMPEDKKEDGGDEKNK